MPYKSDEERRRKQREKYAARKDDPRFIARNQQRRLRFELKKKALQDELYEEHKWDNIDHAPLERVTRNWCREHETHAC